MSFSFSSKSSPGAGRPRRTPAVRLRGEGTDVRFGRSFVIGRDDGCDLQLSGSGRVSRRHAEIRIEEGRWWLVDLDSANGTFLDGRRIEREQLPPTGTLQVGDGGPSLQFAIEAGQLMSDPPRGHTSVPVSEQAGDGASAAKVPQPSKPADRKGLRGPSRDGPAERGPAGPAAGEDLSLSRVMRHYFQDAGDQPAGERTRFIRQAFSQVQEQQRRRYGVLIGAVLCVGLLAVLFGAWQGYRTHQLRSAAEELFYQMREYDLALATRIAADVEISPEQLAEITARRQRAAEAYQGFVEELGVYRRLSQEERYIYQVARIFNESEFSIPAGFVREVQSYIRVWQRSNRFQQAAEYAEQRGKTAVIVRTLRQYGLPPEFFYLAMQESNFNNRAVGPETRWGIAKGAWQFIPDTGERYGLRRGPRYASRVFDPQDQRHDFAAATDAAARYLLEIYTQLAQASGLLVCASYNWGEHRVAPRLDQLPPPGIERARAAMAGIPQNPQERSYWRFFTSYADRMPDETKGYVMHIFAAAVIGQDPRFFGIDMDNPLAKYLEAPLEDLDGAPIDQFEERAPRVDPPPAPPQTPPAEEPSRRLGLDALRESS